MKNIQNTLIKNKRIKVMTIVGTRPEIIRLSRIIEKLDKYYDHTLVHTGQNYDYELNQIFFEDLEIREPDIFMDCADKNVATSIANIISKGDKVLGRLNPEAILILGDTNSTMIAISAKRRKIPIFHMEAGNRSFDLRVPEEINRKVVDHISDINMPYSSIARDYLLREGIRPEFVIKTGSPMNEVISYYKEKIIKSEIIKKLKLSPEKYFLISAHREENIDSTSNISEFIETLDKLANEYNLPIIVSTHPRTRKKIDQIGHKFHRLVNFRNPLCFSDYVFLQMNAKVVLSDSGTITEEASLLNFPAINIREAHERPEGMEEGTVMFTGMSFIRIYQALSIIESQSRGEIRTLSLVNDYSAKNVSEKVIRIIHSYIDYVNKFTWKKY